MSKKRKRISPFTPAEHAAHTAHLRELEERIRVGEAELAARGSEFARVPREERLAFAITRAEAELAAKRSDG